jgi:hypothetical protein
MLGGASAMSARDFIVRIYRETDTRRRLVVGVVEVVGGRGKRAFHSLDELWDILNDRVDDRQKRKRRAVDGPVDGVVADSDQS